MPVTVAITVAVTVTKDRFESFAEVAGFNRLYNEIVRSALHRLYDVQRRGRSGYHNDRYILIESANLLQCLETVLPGHHDVHHDGCNGVLPRVEGC